MFLADFAIEGNFSDGNPFYLRVPEQDIIPFCESILRALVDDINGDVKVTHPHVRINDGKAVFYKGGIKKHNKG